MNVFEAHLKKVLLLVLTTIYYLLLTTSYKVLLLSTTFYLLLTTTHYDVLHLEELLKLGTLELLVGVFIIRLRSRQVGR